MANFETIDLNELSDDLQRLDQEFGKQFLDNLVKMPAKEGYVEVRLLPPAPGGKLYCVTRTHRVNERNIHCPRVLTKGKNGTYWADLDPKSPCPICMYGRDLWAKAEARVKEAGENAGKEYKDAYRQLKANERYYYNCVVRSQVNDKGEVEKNVGPKILSVGTKLHQRIVRAMVGDKKMNEVGLGNITDFKTGRDLKIIKEIAKSGNSEWASYDNSKFLDPSPLGTPEQVESWMANLHDLASLRKLRPIEEIKVELKKHLGIISNEKETNFDITEFQKKSGVSLDEQIRDAQNAQSPATVNAEVKVEGPDTSAHLGEDEFFSRLNNMNSPAKS